MELDPHLLCQVRRRERLHDHADTAGDRHLGGHDVACAHRHVVPAGGTDRIDRRHHRFDLVCLADRAVDHVGRNDLATGRVDANDDRPHPRVVQRNFQLGLDEPDDAVGDRDAIAHGGDDPVDADHEDLVMRLGVSPDLFLGKIQALDAQPGLVVGFSKGRGEQHHVQERAEAEREGDDHGVHEQPGPGGCGRPGKRAARARRRGNGRGKLVHDR